MSVSFAGFPVLQRDSLYLKTTADSRASAISIGFPSLKPWMHDVGGLIASQLPNLRRSLPGSDYKNYYHLMVVPSCFPWPTSSATS
jgi:hypothetical protein